MPAFTELDWYETPHYYDIVFDADTKLEAEFLEEMFERHGPGRRAGKGRKRVLEPACGSGRLMAEMASRGWSCTGFDASAAMVEYARERLAEEGLTCKLFEARMEDFSTRGKFELAHCFISTFKYLMDEDSARANLECVAASLVPGGLYVIGLHLSDYALTTKVRERWVETRGSTEVTCNIQSWPPERLERREQVRSRLVVREGAQELRSETTWWFRTYDVDQLEALLESVPQLEHVATHDFTYDADAELPLDAESFDVVLVLRKRRGRM